MPRKGARKGLPERVVVSLFDDPSGSIPLRLPPRKMWPAGLVMALFFAIMASIAWGQIRSIRGRDVDTIFDLTTFLFQSFWVLGWSIGVFIVGALTFLLLFYGESARIHRGTLVFVSRLGPLRFCAEYDLARIENLRLETAGGDPRDTARIRFDYGEGEVTLGDAMARPDAERITAAIEDASRGNQPVGAPGGEPAGFDLLAWLRRRSVGSDSKPAVIPPPVAPPNAEAWTSSSTLALVGANLVPVAGVILLDWNLGHIMVLFWVESGVIALYNLARLAVVTRWAALVSGPFFAAHFGAFMSAHFLFIYTMFVKGLRSGAPEEPVMAALGGLFRPLWFAVAALVISHGVSFFRNFIGRQEYIGMSAETLMTEPYRRVILMHLTIIFGGWLALLLDTPLPALVLLLALKTFMDLRAHRNEHARSRIRRDHAQAMT